MPTDQNQIVSRLDITGIEEAGPTGPANYKKLIKLDPTGKIDPAFVDAASILADSSAYTAQFFQPASISPLAATGTRNVSGALLAYEPGASDTQTGIVTDPPGNLVALLDDNDRWVHSATTGNQIFARLTAVASFPLAGAVTLTNGLAAVTGVGTSFTTEVEAGDIIKATGGSYVEVLSVTDNFNLTLTAPYPFTNYAGTAERRRWTLSFLEIIAAVETAYTAWTGAEILQWFVQQVYSLVDVPATDVGLSKLLHGSFDDSTLNNLEVQDEGGTIDTDVTKMNFTGTAVTVTPTAPGEIQVNVAIPPMAIDVGTTEDITSQVDGFTITLTLSNPYISGTLKVYRNGQRQDNGEEIIEDSPALGTFHFEDGFGTPVALPLGDKVFVDYVIDGGGGFTALEVQDEGGTIESVTSTMNFTGSGVTVTSTGPGVVEVNVPSTVPTPLEMYGSGTPIALPSDPAPIVDADVNTLRLRGNVQTTNPAPGEVDVYVKFPEISVRDEGSSLGSNFTTLDFVGDAVSVTSPSPGLARINIAGLSGGSGATQVFNAIGTTDVSVTPISQGFLPQTFLMFNMPQMAVTVAPTSTKTLLVFFNATFGNQITGGYGLVDITVDSVRKITGLVRFEGTVTNAGRNITSFGSTGTPATSHLQWTQSLTAGSHTIRVRWGYLGYEEKAFMINNPGTKPEIYHRNLIVMLV